MFVSDRPQQCDQNTNRKNTILCNESSHSFFSTERNCIPASSNAFVMGFRLPLGKGHFLISNAVLKLLFKQS